MMVGEYQVEIVPISKIDYHVFQICLLAIILTGACFFWFKYIMIMMKHKMAQE